MHIKHLCIAFNTLFGQSILIYLCFATIERYSVFYYIFLLLISTRQRNVRNKSNKTFCMRSFPLDGMLWLAASVAKQLETVLNIFDFILFFFYTFQFLYCCCVFLFFFGCILRFHRLLDCFEPTLSTNQWTAFGVLSKLMNVS